MTKPNSISWMCQLSGSKRLGNSMSPASNGSHAAIDSADHVAAARKNGRNPAVSNGGMRFTLRSSALPP